MDMSDNSVLEQGQAQAENSEYFKQQNLVFDTLYQKQQAELAGKPRTSIIITLPNGDKHEGVSWETAPMSIAKQLLWPTKLVVAAKVNNELWDLLRPLEADSSLELVDFESEEGKLVYWRSSAFILSGACEQHFGGLSCETKQNNSGFYCDIAVPETLDHGVSQSDFAPLEQLAGKTIKAKHLFERLVLTKDNLLRMFAYNRYKMHLINISVADGTMATAYRCGSIVDVCSGPHMPGSSSIAAFAVLKSSGSYFMGDSNNDSLQRIYGISFPDKKKMAAYRQFLEEAANRDHRKIGREQELFFFHKLSPGSAFFLPHGTRIYNTLIGFIRNKYRERGFEEVVTPNMFNTKLWEQSGHWQNYQDVMFGLEVDREQFALKPMNCPGHCLMFGVRDRSYRELPIRFADFGVLHRNEASGALSGLTRVRRFQQDDAHIFCRQDQVKNEIRGALDFLSEVYGIFGFTFRLKLSTRPQNYIGDIGMWDQAERHLQEALCEFGAEWELNPGDGAFYGPKIDITICDALGRDQQCATIQLDFQLPERFQLQFRAPGEGEDGFQRPVIIHRAILGSVERMIAILTEHYAGKWPLWLSPRQAMVVPTNSAAYEYAEQVKQQLHDAVFYADVDVGSDTLNKKIRNAELAQYNFICVVGAQEMQEHSVNVRCRDDVGTKAKGQTVPVSAFIQRLTDMKSK